MSWLSTGVDFAAGIAESMTQRHIYSPRVHVAQARLGTMAGTIGAAAMVSQRTQDYVINERPLSCPVR
jgi:hypothetical protein